MYTYTKSSKIDTPAQGMLYSAREAKKKWYGQVKRLRDRIKNEPLNGNRHGLRLELLKAEERWHEAQTNERSALRAIEQRANELGLTTIHPKKGAIND